MALGTQYTHQARLKLSRKSKRDRRQKKRDRHAGIKEAQKKHAVRRERNKVLQSVTRSERRRLRRELGKAGACDALKE